MKIKLTSSELVNIFGLTDEQISAVTSNALRVLVFAGPGTGKTRVLSCRYIYLMHNFDTQNKEILAITFTNKAANEIRERINLYQEKIKKLHNTSYNQEQNDSNNNDLNKQNPWIGTFHSICLKIIKNHTEIINYKPGFQVIDVSSQYNIIGSIISDRHTNKKDIEIDKKNTKKINNLALSFINQLKDSKEYFDYMNTNIFSKKSMIESKYHNNITLNNISNTPIEENKNYVTEDNLRNTRYELENSQNNFGNLFSFPNDFWSNFLEKNKDFVELFNHTHPNHILQSYQNALIKNNVIDFADIISKTIELLSHNESILNFYKNMFLSILVDEYQDTNHMQRKFLQLLCQENVGIFCVGDDDQSIYSWRGAGESMMNFKHDFSIISEKSANKTDHKTSNQSNSGININESCNDFSYKYKNISYTKINNNNVTTNSYNSIDNTSCTNISHNALTSLIDHKNNVHAPNDPSYHTNDINPITYNQEIKIFKMSKNYRSSNQIIRAAQSLIRKNIKRIDKNISSAHDIQGNKVTLVQYKNHIEEAAQIAKYITINQSQKSSIAILVRNNSQMQVFEEELSAQKIQYIVVGETKFYNFKEIKIAISYIRSAIYTDDDISFDKIINFPKRGIGDTFMKKIRSQKNKSLQETCRELFLSFQQNSLFEISFSLSSKSTDNIKNLLSTLEKFKNIFLSLNDFSKNNISLASYLSKSTIESTASILKIFDKVNPSNKSSEKCKNNTLSQAILSLIIEVNLYQSSLELDLLDPRTSKSRIENLTELARIAGNFENIFDFLDAMSLHIDSSQDHSQTNSVFLMTMHAAKGLEFDEVFLPGWEKTILPSIRSLDDKGFIGLEEERRLAYVAMTRAKKTLNISYSCSRMIDGTWKSSSGSRFLYDIDSDYLDTNISQSNHSINKKNYYSERRSESRFTKNSYTNKVSQKDSNTYSTGDIVKHEQFKTGVVISCNKDVVSVRFETGIKQILKTFLHKI